MKRLERIKEILNSTQSKEKQTYCLGLIMTYHAKDLTLDELFSFIPYIWMVNNNSKFPIFRGKLEREITNRQTKETIEKLIELLKDHNSNYRFVAADLLNRFNNEIVIGPLLEYLMTTQDDLLIKRQAVCALTKYNDPKVRSFLSSEYDRLRGKPKDFVLDNYLFPIEMALNNNSFKNTNNAT